MKRKLLVLVLITLTLTLCLVGCGNVTEKDANGVYVNVEIENSTASVELMVAEDGAFTLQTFTISAEGKTAAVISEEIVSDYESNVDFSTYDKYELKKGTYTYSDNAFIVKRMSLKYDGGGNEFCYLSKNGNTFELSPTLPVVLVYCLIGFLVTLFVLAFLMLVIKLLSLVADKIQALKDKKKKPEETQTQEAPALPVYAKGSAGELKLTGVSEKDAAMIMAILADELQVPLNTLRFISITDITDSEVEK